MGKTEAVNEGHAKPRDRKRSAERDSERGEGVEEQWCQRNA